MSLAIDYEKRTEIRWQTPMAHGAALIRKLIAAGWPDEVMLNVNFPDVEPEEVRGIGVTAQGKRDQDYLRIIDRTDARGNPYYWLGFNRQISEPEEGTDLWALRRGLISVTPLHLNLTDIETCRKLKLGLGPETM